MMRPPHTVTVYAENYHGQAYETDHPHKTACAALDFLEHGISWGNPHIKFAQLYDDVGEPARLENVQTMKVFKR